MHSINFNELGFKNLRKELDKELIIECSVQGQKIEIKTTIPTEDKIRLVSAILSNSVDDTAGYFNPYRLKIVGAIEGMEYYSNFNFGEEKFENIYDIYDILDDEGFLDILYNQTDFDCLFKMVEECAKSIVAYNNSVAGVIMGMKDNGSEVNEQLSNILSQIKDDPDIKNFVQNIMPNLG